LQPPDSDWYHSQLPYIEYPWRYTFEVYSYDVNILGGSMHTIKENTEALVVASSEIGLEVNAEKTKYMVMSWDENAGQNHKIEIGNK
jgi:hypothetical protein